MVFMTQFSKFKMYSLGFISVICLYIYIIISLNTIALSILKSRKAKIELIFFDNKQNVDAKK